MPEGPMNEAMVAEGAAVPVRGIIDADLFRAAIDHALDALMDADNAERPKKKNPITGWRNDELCDAYQVLHAAPRLLSERNSLRAQRDELLAALRNLARGLENVPGLPYDVARSEILEKPYLAALTLIAKCEAAP